MGLKWFDYVGHAAVGAMDKDAEIRKEQLDRRFKELDENKTMYRALATTRYSKDLDKFEEETKKYDALKSVYANIENNNYHPNTAARMILSAQDSNFKSYDKETQDTMAENVAAGFEKVYEGEGEDKKEVGFKVYHDELNIQAPQRGDYFKGPDFWSKLSDEIRSGTVGPLQEQIIKLFGSKHHPAEVNLGDNEAIKGTEIKNFIKENDVNKKAYYTSKNVGGVDGFDFADFEKNNEKWVTDYKNLIKDVEWGSINANDNFLNFLTQLDLEGATTEANFEFKDNDIVIKNLSGDKANNARAIIATYKSIYNSAIASIDPRLLAMQGVARVDLPGKVNRAEINKTVRQLFEHRGWSENFDTLALFDEKDFIGYLSTNIVDLKGNITLPDGKIIKSNDLKKESNILIQYQQFLKDEAEELLKEKGNNAEKMGGNKLVNAMNIIQTQMRDSDNNEYLKKFLSNLNLDLKDTDSSSTESSSETTTTTNKIKVVTEKGVQGISRWNEKKQEHEFTSWEQLEKENKIEILPEYLKIEYNKYKEGSSLIKKDEKSGVEYIPWG
jgi:hypothetical protein